MNKFSTATAGIVTLLAAGALATGAVAEQMPTTPQTRAAPPAATAPAATSPATAGAVTFIDKKATGQRLASNLIGMTVRGPGDETLGEIDDVVVDDSGRVVGTVIGVGGFLGVGEKDVAVPYETVEFIGSGEDAHAVLNKTKDQLKAAPTFKAEAPATTGSAKPAAR